jgi:hypothetical protein
MEFTNEITLTDDELSAVMVALQSTLQSLEAYEKQGNVLGFADKEAKEEIAKVHRKLRNDFF